VLFVHLLVEAGYGCSLSVASNVFVITNLTFTCRNKNNAPHECGNPKCKVIALGWLSDERFPRDHRHQSAASLANRIAGARDRSVRRRCRTAPARMRRGMPCSIVKATALYTNWLAPGFNIDSRERVYSERQSPNCQEPNFQALAAQSERKLTPNCNNSYGTLTKTIKTIS
jgi:hypothetical protein